MKGSRDSLLQKGEGGRVCVAGALAQLKYQYRKWLRTRRRTSAHCVSPSNAKCHAISDLRDRKT